MNIVKPKKAYDLAIEKFGMITQQKDKFRILNQ